MSPQGRRRRGYCPVKPGNDEAYDLLTLVEILVDLQACEILAQDGNIVGRVWARTSAKRSLDRSELGRYRTATPAALGAPPRAP